MGANKKEEELKELADLLITTVKNLFQVRGELKFSKEPELKFGDIIEYNGKMRADGMKIFNDPTFVSTVNFYLNAKSMEKHDALGALIFYIEQGYVVPLLKKLKYPPVDDEDEEAMKDGCGTIGNIIAGAYKTALVQKGYIELEMSHFSTYRNSAYGGVEFCFKEWHKYEMDFEIAGEKRFVMELTMGQIPRAK